jgi:hypothetical protein
MAVPFCADTDHCPSPHAQAGKGRLKSAKYLLINDEAVSELRAVMAGIKVIYHPIWGGRGRDTGR